MRKQNGITLIALVITIIVMLILVGVIVSYAVNEGGVILRAKESAFKQDIRSYQEELFGYVASHYEETRQDKINVQIEDDEYESNMKNYIPNINKKYFKKIFIQDNKLCYNYTGNKRELKWAEELGLLTRKETIIIKTIVEGEGTAKVNGQDAQEGLEVLTDGSIILTAEPGNKTVGEQEITYEFSGWYDEENNFLSNELEYTISNNPIQDTTYTAKFIPEVTLIYLDDKTVEVNTNSTISRI